MCVLGGGGRGGGFEMGVRWFGVHKFFKGGGLRKGVWRWGLVGWISGVKGSFWGGGGGVVRGVGVACGLVRFPSDADDGMPATRDTDPHQSCHPPIHLSVHLAHSGTDLTNHATHPSLYLSIWPTAARLTSPLAAFSSHASGLAKSKPPAAASCSSAVG